jgi:nucleotide-binding universal stress UspA family protein
MSTPTQTRPVVVGFRDHGSEPALAWAADEAARLDVPLRVLHTYAAEVAFPWGYGYPLPSADIRRVAERAKQDAQALAQEAAGRVRDRHPGLEVDTTVQETNAPAALVLASQGASTVVVARRARHRWAAALGSVSLVVAAHAGCPVVVVPGTAPDEHPAGGEPAAEEPAAEEPAAEDQAAQDPTRGQVVVGVDDTAECSDAIGFGFAQACGRGVGLVAVHTWWMDPALISSYTALDEEMVTEQETSAMDSVLAPWSARYPAVPVRRLVVRAHPAAALTSAADGAAMLVVGSRGRGGFASLLLGSVSRGVLQHATGPVAVVRRGQFSERDQAR